jgi:hypothetical protein
MNTQPEALRLADELDSTCPYFNAKQAAAELRRLHEVNQMLVERLELANQALETIQIDITDSRLIHAENEIAIAKAIVKATLAKAKEQA